jgi:Polysaccharide lyase
MPLLTTKYESKKTVSKNDNTPFTNLKQSITYMISVSILMTGTVIIAFSQYIYPQAMAEKNIVDNRSPTAPPDCPNNSIGINFTGISTALNNNPPPNDVTGVTPNYIKYLLFKIGSLSTGWEWGSTNHEAGQTDRLITINKNIVDNTFHTNNVDTNSTNVLRVFVNSGDCFKFGARSEVWFLNNTLHKGTFNFLEGDDVWYHWYVMFPNNLTLPASPLGTTGWNIITEEHGQLDPDKVTGKGPDLCHGPNNNTIDCGLVPMGFNLRNWSQPEPGTGATGPNLEFTIFNSSDPHGNGPPTVLWTTWNKASATSTLQFNHWYDILLHVKYERCAGYDAHGICTNNNGGFVEMWIDQKNVVPKTMHYTMATTLNGTTFDPVVMQSGLYHCTIVQDGNNLCHGMNFGNENVYYGGTTVAVCTPNNDFFHPDTARCFATKPPYSKVVKYN